MLVGFVKYLLPACMDFTVPQFTVSHSLCAASRDLLRFGWLLSDSVKCKGAPCVQGIECGAQNRQKSKPPAKPNLIKIIHQKNPSLREKARDGFINT